MKLKKLNCNTVYGYYIELTKHVNLSLCFFKRLNTQIDVKTTSIIDRQITELTLFNLYVRLSTPICLLWVTEKELMSFALDTFKNRLHDIEDNLAEYILTDNKELDYDAIAESQVLYQVINFYGSNKPDERGTGR